MLLLIVLLLLLLVEKLESNSHYIFRVWAYSILGVGEVSPMIEINIEDYDHNDSQLHFRAMIASIIGGFIFFSMSIVLILCLVKVCNKKKRRKIEKCMYYIIIHSFIHLSYGFILHLIQT